MAAWNVFLGNVEKHAMEHPLIKNTHGKTLLSLPGKGIPVGLAEVGEGAVGRFWEVHGKSTSQLNENGEVIRIEGG